MSGPKRTASGTRMKGAIVMLVMSDAHIRSRFAEVLCASGYLILEAPDWMAGMSKTLKLRPDAVALDVSLLAPGSTSAVRLLSTHARTSHIPLLALSDRTWRPAALRAMGFHGVLERPCSQHELIEAVRHVLEKRAIAVRVS